MAVPRYLHGQSYHFSGDMTSPRQNEIDMSYLRINPDSPTVIQFQYRTGLSKNVTIFEKSDFILSNDLVGFYSYNSKVEANLRIKFAYGGTIRSSTIQLMAIEEMNSAELFLILQIIQVITVYMNQTQIIILQLMITIIIIISPKPQVVYQVSNMRQFLLTI